jgi:tetratricopeptide (TPR) repeat protein
MKDINSFVTLMNEQLNILQSAYERLQDAEELRRAGNLDHAETIARQLLDENPAYWGARHTLGLVYFDKRQFNEAYDQLSRAALLSPENPLTMALLARTCLELEQTGLAERWSEAALRIAPENPHVLFAHGEVYRADNEYMRALELYERVLSVDADHIQAKTALCSCLIDLGQHAEAAQLLTSMMTFRQIEPIHELARLPEGTSRINVLEALNRLEPSLPHKSAEDEITIAFLKAAALHNTGRFTEAWNHILKANRLALRGREEELERQENHECMTLEAMRSAVGRYRPHPVNPQRPKSLFILGPSRSGKTSLERLIATIEGVCAGFESRLLRCAVRESFQDAGLLPCETFDLLPLELHEECRERYFRALSRKYGSARIVTNTSPGLIADAVRIAAVIPNAYFVLVQRNVEDTLLRILMKSYRAGNVYAYDPNAARRHIVWYNEMMRLLSETYPERTLLVGYEDMVERPRSVLEIVAEFIGLDPPATSPVMPIDDRNCAGPYRDLPAAGVLVRSPVLPA